MTVTKADLAEALFDEIGFTKRESKEFVDEFFELMRETLEQGEGIKLSGFGNFTVRDKSPRPGRNPKTGEEVPISARRVVTFRQSQILKGAVAANTPALEKKLLDK